MTTFSNYVAENGNQLAQMTNEEIYVSLLNYVKELASQKGKNTAKRKVYYISAEFLIGKLLSNNLINLGIYKDVKKELASFKGQTGLTFCGGEPLLQAKACLEIAKFVKEELGWNVWSFTGLIFEKIPKDSEAWEFVEYLDALIDGPFILAKRDLTLKFRGSQNQRLFHLNHGEIVSVE